jgi:hypothetical protein
MPSLGYLLEFTTFTSVTEIDTDGRQSCNQRLRENRT